MIDTDVLSKTREVAKDNSHDNDTTSFGLTPRLSSEELSAQNRVSHMIEQNDRERLVKLRDNHAVILQQDQSEHPQTADVELRNDESDMTKMFLFPKVAGTNQSDIALEEKKAGGHPISRMKRIAADFMQKVGEKFIAEPASPMDVAIAKPEKLLLKAERAQRVEAFHKELKEADSFFFISQFKIGDTLMTLNYMEAMMRKIRTMNDHADFTIVVSAATYNMLKPLEERMPRLRIMRGTQEDNMNPNYTAIKENWRQNGRENDADLLRQQTTPSKAFVFDFEGTFEDVYKTTDNHAGLANATYFDDLFDQATRYDNRYGQERYNTFADLLLQDQSPLPYERAEIPLPKDHEEQYTAIAERCGIDMTKSQVSVVLESGSTGRQYSLEQYVETVKLLQERHPELAFNFIVNRKKAADDLTLVDEAKLLTLLQKNEINDAHVVSGSLLELVSLFNKQKLIISNDGGILHVAGATEGAPPVIGIFLPGLGDFWSADPERVIPLEPEEIYDDDFTPDFSEVDDSKKEINKIPPLRIVDTADRILSDNSYSP